MKKIFQHISKALFIILSVMSLQSCSGDYVIFNNNEDSASDETTFILKVRNISASVEGVINPLERINSLRVVMLGQDKDETGNETDNFKVEYNRIFTSTIDSDGSYNVVMKTFPGLKKIFLFANEESVTDIKYEGIESGEVSNLHELLEEAFIGAEGFESIINSVSFNLSPENLIPYASYYEKELLKGTSDHEFYLVPAASKFTLKFNNRRSDNVTFDSVDISSVAEENFLIAHVGENDLFKTFNQQSGKLYWIDWLRAVTEDMQENYPGGEASAQETYGWISDYDLPDCNHTIFSSPSFEVMYGETVEKTFYVPESRFFDNNGEFQDYSLSFNIKDNEEPILIKLPKLHALFRNTHVILNVTMRELLKLTVTYTVCPWDERDTYIMFD